jgi:uncharacterized protein YjiS (DUF1127 family)
MTELIASYGKELPGDQKQQFFRRIIERYRRRRDAALLAKLDDHILTDIGLTRFDIDMLARS